MQTTGSAPGQVATQAVTVRAGNVTRDVTSLRIRRELAWSPDGSDSGITAATGTALWAPGGHVARRAPNPWSAGDWPPPPGETVTVDIGWDGEPVRQLTGVIDQSQGSLADMSTASDLVDYIDALNNIVDRPAMAARLPTSQGTSRPGLTTQFMADDAMRRAGFHSTPPIGDGCITCAPLQGSAWPNRGTWGGLVSANSDADSLPTWQATPWGLGAADLHAAYEPQAPSGYGDMEITPTRPLQVTAMVAPGTPTQFANVQVRWGANDWVGLSIGPSGGDLAIRVALVAGGTSIPVSMPRGGSTTFSAVIESNGDVTLYADDGRTATGSLSLPASFTSTPVSTVRVVIPDGAPVLGGAHASFVPDPIATTWTPDARLSVTAPTPAVAAPAVEDVTALQLLREQASAEVAAMWIDEHGVLQWMDRGSLLGRQPVATITSETGLLDLRWSSSVSTVRSDVRVSWRACTMRVRANPTITLWQGRGDSLTSGDVNEDFTGPDRDEEWFSVRTDVLLVSQSGGVTALNEGQRTLSGGMLVEDGESDVEATASHVTTTVALVGRRRYVVTTTAGSIPSGKNLTLRAPDYSTISPTRRGMDLPVVRGRGLARWADRTSTGATTGPARMPVLEHDAGLYAQSGGVAQATADWLASHVTAPAPVADSVPVVPDLRRQLGDIVTIEDPHVSGLRLTALITAIDIQVDTTPARTTQTLGIYVISAETPWATLDELDAAWTGTTLDDVETARTGDTLDDVDANPLEGA